MKHVSHSTLCSSWNLRNQMTLSPFHFLPLKNWGFGPLHRISLTQGNHPSSTGPCTFNMNRRLFQLKILIYTSDNYFSFHFHKSLNIYQNTIINYGWILKSSLIKLWHFHELHLYVYIILKKIMFRLIYIKKFNIILLFSFVWSINHLSFLVVNLMCLLNINSIFVNSFKFFVILYLFQWWRRINITLCS